MSTYYLSPSGDDSYSSAQAQNPATPWKTTTKAFVEGGGHTYTFLDGTYDYSGGNINNPPSGSSGTPTIVQSANDGLAVIDGANARSGIIVGGESTTREYVTILGFKVTNTGENAGVIVASPDGTSVENETNNIIIKKVGATADIQAANGSVWTIARCRNSLFEDVWGWGDGRYTLNVYGCTSVTVRRGVFRWDDWGDGADKPGDPKFNMGVYNTHDSLFENVILIDHNTTAYGGDIGGLYVPGNDNGDTAPYTDSDDNQFLGVIILHNVGRGIGVEGGSGGSNDNNTFVNCIAWDNTTVGVSVYTNASGTIFNHCTFGGNDTGGFYCGVSDTSVTNSLISGNVNYAFNGSVVNDYNDAYSSSSYINGASAGAHSIIQDPQLLYITRIESGSPCKGTGSDSGDMGANCLYRYQDGVLTGTSLWPWPYESRIKEDMASYSTRGFCATGETLTHYIWNYLGNGGYPGSQIGVKQSLRIRF